MNGSVLVERPGFISPRQRDPKKVRGVFEKVPGSGEWWICFFDEYGKKHREKVGPKGLATDLYRKRKTEVRERRFFPEKLRRRGVSFAEIAKDALDYARAKKSPDAYKIDKWHMETLLRWFRERGAEQVTPLDIERRLAELADDGLSPATVNRYHALVSLVFSLAVRNGKASSNPAKSVKYRDENNSRLRFLDEDDEQRLRATIRELYPDYEAEFDLALNTGMRRGEQYRLRWQDVDLKRRIISVRRSKNGDPRHIPMNACTRRALEVLRTQTGSFAYVCPGSEGARGRDWRRWFGDAAEKAKVTDFRWHDLRHTFASRLVMAGVDLRTVQELLGHRDIQMTLRYAHLSPAHKQEAVERLTRRPTDTATDTSGSATSKPGERPGA